MLAHQYSSLLQFIAMYLLLNVSGIEVSITKTWDGVAVDHKPVVIRLEPHSYDQSFQMIVNAPFFEDPANPGGDIGRPFFGLWNYEVVELFLANAEDQYVEIELCPWGQHIVLLLNGTSNAIRHSLPLDFSVEERYGGEWQGRAIIPVDYLPPRVTRMNAYAIHGSHSKRTYEALYPTATGQFTSPDFHRLEFFQPIDMSSIVPVEVTELSDVWTSEQKSN